MASPVVNVTLLAPGLGRDASTSAVQWSDAHALQPWQDRFCRQLDQKQWHGRNLPVAELLIGTGRDNRHETDDIMQDGLICADPIHLRADRDTARLVPAAMLSLSEVEADALLTSINEFLAEDDLRLSRSDACHWYMQGMDGSTLLTFPPEFLARRNASAFLPEGEATGRWKRLLTELQMLLHAHPVNAERERRGLMPVNSLWFWGGASLTANRSARPSAEVPVNTSGDSSSDSSDESSDESSGVSSGGSHEDCLEISAGASAEAPLAQPAAPRETAALTLEAEPLPPRIFADEPFAVALARHLGLECQPLDEFDPVKVDSNVLVVDCRLEQAMLAQDESGVVQARQRFVEEWAGCWQDRLLRGENITLEIFDEDGSYGRLDARVLSRLTEGADSGSPWRKASPIRLLQDLSGKALALWHRMTGTHR